MYYLCTACGRTFDHPVHYRECLDHDLLYYEEWDGCPACGESAYVETDGI